MSKHSLVRVGSSILRHDRTLNRELARLNASTTVEVAETRAIEAVEIAKIEALGSIAQAAEAEAVRLSAAELALAEQYPYAFERLRLIGQTGGIALARRVERADRRLG